MSISEGSADLAGSTATNGWLNLSGLAYGRIESPFDSDWFVTYLVAGYRYQFGMLGSSMDAYLALRNSTGQLVASADSWGVNGSEWVTFTPTVSGVYYVDAQSSWRAFGSAAVGAYSVLMISNGTDDYEATTSTTSTLVVGGSKGGTLELPADADFHGANLVEGKAYRVQLSGPLANGYLAVYDQYGTRIGSGGVGQLEFTPGWSGKFFFEVSGNRLADWGAYTLSLRELPNLSAESMYVIEGAAGATTSLKFSFRLSQPSSDAVTFTFATKDGTAVAGFDYQAVSRSVTIPAGASSAEVQVPVFGNAYFEPSRVFDVQVSAVTGAAYQGRLFGEIRDDDTPEGISLPIDPYAAWQWHLYTVRAHWAWQLATGKGVKIGVLDQGVDRANPDLARNTSLALGVNASNLSAGGAPLASTDNHGTSVAGVIGAARDGNGVVGVAYDSTIVPIYSPLRFGQQYITEITNAFRYAQSLDVLNNSWGFGNLLQTDTNWAFLDDAKSPTFAPAFAALKDLATVGRKGLGTVVVQSAGNSFSVGDDTNLHNFQNSRYVVTVGATDAFGRASSFSTTGASVLVSAPGGAGNQSWGSILTTDRSNSAGYSNTDLAWIDGTSFSAPIVSGIVGMMLEVNPGLGYRDVQQILAMTARQTNVGVGEWKSNGATNWNGGGMHFNALTHATGFGQVDALAAVRLAAAWDQPAQTSANVKEVSARKDVREAIPDGTGLSYSQLQISEQMLVERVDVTVNIQHSFIGDLAIILTSPAGTSSFLMYRPSQGALGAYGSSQDDVRFTFDTVLNWGESSVGSWSIGVFDIERGEVGTFLDWGITLIGRPDTTNDVYVYTNEYPDVVARDPARGVLRDSDGGLETINFGALGLDSRVDLSGRTASNLNGAPFAVSAGVRVGTVIAGTGDDALIAGTLPVTFRGGLGDDYLGGGPGGDVLVGGDGADLMTGGSGDDWLEPGRGNDVLQGNDGLDRIRFEGLKGSYRLVKQPNRPATEYSITAPDGSVDVFSTVERLVFSDLSVALDLQGAAGGAARLIGALFGPEQLAAERVVGKWLALLDGGASLSQAVAQAVASAEFLAAAGSTSNRDFVNLVYRNVVGVLPGPGELAHFVGLLDRGEYTQASLALMAVELDLTAQRVDLVGLTGTGLEYVAG
ncbi:S8 family serine peptidase [Inhella sp.]|uniref:S8 family serine peptidase n=1 Tax=Inhella sp. TaxID=1921806 RepID=UPI0035ADE950